MAFQNTQFPTDYSTTQHNTENPGPGPYTVPGPGVGATVAAPSVLQNPVLTHLTLESSQGESTLALSEFERVTPNTLTRFAPRYITLPLAPRAGRAELYEGRAAPTSGGISKCPLA